MQHDGYKPAYRKFQLDKRKLFFTVSVVKHRKMLSREVLESPSVQVFKVQLEMALVWVMVWTT